MKKKSAKKGATELKKSIKKRKAVGPDHIKRPLSKYLLFCEDYRKQIKSEGIQLTPLKIV